MLNIFDYSFSGSHFEEKLIANSYKSVKVSILVSTCFAESLSSKNGTKWPTSFGLAVKQSFRSCFSVSGFTLKVSFCGGVKLIG